MKPQALALLHARCFTTPRPWRAEEIADFLSDKTSDLVSAPNGFALIRTIIDETELLTIAVDPDNRRQGAAMTLLERAIGKATTRHATQMFLEVAATNKPAIALYQKFGFKQSGRRSGYYLFPGGVRIDAVLMARDI